jgi:predicted RNA-binding Zn-ribbon protein involved in translation (DUF1610 family)
MEETEKKQPNIFRCLTCGLPLTLESMVWLNNCPRCGAIHKETDRARAERAARALAGGWPKVGDTVYSSRVMIDCALPSSAAIEEHFAAVEKKHVPQPYRYFLTHTPAAYTIGQQVDVEGVAMVIHSIIEVEPTQLAAGGTAPCWRVEVELIEND